MVDLFKLHFGHFEAAQYVWDNSREETKLKLSQNKDKNGAILISTAFYMQYEPFVKTL